MLLVLTTLGLFMSFSSLNKSDLASKYIKTIEMQDAKGKAAKFDNESNKSYQQIE